MSGFTWKKRSGQCISSQPRLAAFSTSDDEASGSDSGEDSAVAVMDPAARTGAPPACSGPCAAARPALSDAEQAAALREQGAALAELGRFWEALKCWDEAAALLPADAALHEMRAQALLHVHELRPAVEAAARAAALSPRWPAAQQTLGRALLALGELALARRAFSVALHVRPDDGELRTEDLLWSCQLLERARRRARELGGLAAYGGVVSDEQTGALLRLLGWRPEVTAAAARCHADWPPLAADRLAEEQEQEAEEQRRLEQETEERARRDVEHRERQYKAAVRRARDRDADHDRMEVE